MSPEDVLFDASKYPEYAEMKKITNAVWNLILTTSIFLWPFFIAIIYIGYSDEPPGSGIPKDVLLFLLIVLWVADIAFVYWIKKKLTNRAYRPIRITSQGVELSRNKILLATEISKVMIDVQGNIALFMPGKKLPAYTLSRPHLGNADEFIRVLKNQNPLLEIEDIREQIKKYQAEKKAKKEARKGL